jgi:hypothetical protein
LPSAEALGSSQYADSSGALPTKVAGGSATAKWIPEHSAQAGRTRRREGRKQDIVDRLPLHRGRERGESGFDRSRRSRRRRRASRAHRRLAGVSCSAGDPAEPTAPRLAARRADDALPFTIRPAPRPFSPPPRPRESPASRQSKTASGSSSSSSSSSRRRRCSSSSSLTHRRPPSTLISRHRRRSPHPTAPPPRALRRRRLAPGRRPCSGPRPPAHPPAPTTRTLLRAAPRCSTSSKGRPFRRLSCRTPSISHTATTRRSAITTTISSSSKAANPCLRWARSRLSHRSRPWARTRQARQRPMTAASNVPTRHRARPTPRRRRPLTWIQRRRRRQRRPRRPTRRSSRRRPCGATWLAINVGAGPSLSLLLPQLRRVERAPSPMPWASCSSRANPSFPAILQETQVRLAPAAVHAVLESSAVVSRIASAGDGGARDVVPVHLRRCGPPVDRSGSL